MKRVGLLLTAGLLLLGGSALRAGEPVAIPGTLNLAPAPAEPAKSCCTGPGCGSHCAGPGCGSTCHCRHSRNLCDWLLYKPPSCHACCGVVSTCWPPTYTWFLDMCQGGCGSCDRGGCGSSCSAHATPCAGGGCGKTAPAPVVTTHQP
jgi:hypothetical protein